MSEIKPIETRYKRVLFRSRLEARWAVFFDSMGISWQYEPEGFGFGGMKYLPDFLLRETKLLVNDLGCDSTKSSLEHNAIYVEIKPHTHPRFHEGLATIGFLLNHPTLLCLGSPGLTGQLGVCNQAPIAECYLHFPTYSPHRAKFNRCDWCWKSWIEEYAYQQTFHPNAPDTPCPYCCGNGQGNWIAVQDACFKASEHRFW